MGEPRGDVPQVVDRLLAAEAGREHAAATALGIRRVDILALEHVDRLDEVTPGELAKRLHLSFSGVSAVVDRLVRLGLLVRRPGRDARRRVILQLTASGREGMRLTRGNVDEKLSDVLAALGVEQRRVVLDTLQLLAIGVEDHAASLDTAPGPAPAGGVTLPVQWG